MMNDEAAWDTAGVSIPPNASIADDGRNRRVAGGVAVAGFRSDIPGNCDNHELSAAGAVITCISPVLVVVLIGINALVQMFG
jgi:hypothetical protein